jgi:predicted Zn-dependent protease
MTMAFGRQSSRRRAALVALLVVAVAACTTVQTTQPGTVGVQREQRVSPLVSENQLREGAAQAYRDVLTQARAQGALNRDPQTLARVRSIAQRLIAQTPVFRGDAVGWPWEINVIETSEVNAWVMPGGKIAVYTGLLDRLQLTDDQIAAVLGHEIAHALREHARERASYAVGQGLALSVLGAATGIDQGALDLAQLALDVTLKLPHSREQETEADRIGVELAARAGFDPRAAITLWQKMAQVGGSGPPQFLSTHPSRDARIRDLGQYAQRVMPLYRNAAG